MGMGKRRAKVKKSADAAAVSRASTLAPVDFLAQLEDAVDDLRNDLDYAFAQFSERLNGLRGVSLVPAPSSTKPSLIEALPAPPKIEPSKPAKTNHVVSTGKDLGDGELFPASLRILEVMVAWEAPITPTLLSFFTGYSLTSGSFNKALAQVKAHGLVYVPSPATLTLSEKGSLAVGSAPALPRGTDLLRMTADRFDPCSAAILNVAYDFFPREYSAREVAPMTKSPTGQPYSSTSGSFNKAIAKLRKQGLIPDRGHIRLSDDFALAAGLDRR